MRIILLILLLCCSGCMQDDVKDLKAMSEINFDENNRTFYVTGVTDGLMLTGVSYEEASNTAEVLADGWW